MKHANFLTGLVVGALVFGSTTAYAAGIMAERSTNRILVDGKEVQIEAYAIHDNNYMKLRDIGKAVGFNVYWNAEDGSVQIETDKPYTGEAPAKGEAADDADAMKQDIVDRTNALRKENGSANHAQTKPLQTAMPCMKCASRLKNRQTQPFIFRSYVPTVNLPWTFHTIRQRSFSTRPLLLKHFPMLISSLLPTSFGIFTIKHLNHIQKCRIHIPA